MADKKQYFEIHTSAKNQALASDIARHLHSRQYLGRALVICDNPFALLSACRKQWLRIMRAIQLQRASTLNAEEILRFTHAIMHMQHVFFVGREPDMTNQGHVFFVSPDQLESLPADCHSVYLTTPIADEQITSLTRRLPENSLFINYNTGLNLSGFHMLPKSQLEANVLKKWEELDHYLRGQGINPQYFVGDHPQFESVNEALDALLTTSGDFLRRAAEFRHAIDLAQPLATISADYIKMFDAITRLAHRVQTLSPANLTGFMVKTFGDGDSFFLRDVGSETYVSYLEDPQNSAYIAQETNFF